MVLHGWLGIALLGFEWFWLTKLSMTRCNRSALLGLAGFGGPGLELVFHNAQVVALTHNY